jgi:hypothetical protein
MSGDADTVPQPRRCPLCGASLPPANHFVASVTCQSCGTLVSNDARRRWYADPAAARQKARPPAIGLMIAGALFITSGMAMPAFLAVGLVSGDMPQDQEALVMALFFGVFSLATLVFGGIIVFGGYRMYHLRTWPLALVAAIFSTISIFSCCMFSIFGVLTLPGFPIGIWALIVLGDRNVKACFDGGNI